MAGSMATGADEVKEPASAALIPSGGLISEGLSEQSLKIVEHRQGD
jgi:hypothetical protein